MTKFTLALGAPLLALAACGGNGDDKLGDEAGDALENRADNMDAMADNMTGAAEDMMEANADATRAAADDKEEAIDDSDVDTSQMTAEERANVVNAN